MSFEGLKKYRFFTLPRDVIMSAALVFVMGAILTYLLSDIWNTREDYSFGYLMPVFVLYVLYDRWAKIYSYFSSPLEPGESANGGALQAAVGAGFGITAVAGIVLFIFFGLLFIIAQGRTSAIFPMTVGFSLIFFTSAYFASAKNLAGEKMPLKRRWDFVMLFVFPAFAWIISAPVFGVVEEKISLFLLSKVAYVVLNVMQKQEDNDLGRRWRRMFSGMSDAQRAAIYLDGKSFEQAIADRDLSPVIFYEMLKLKANYLKNYVTSKVPAKEFKQFMADFAYTHQFSEATFGELNKEFVDRFHFNLMDLIPGWYSSTEIPVILVKGAAAEEVSIDDRTKYIVHFYVHNPTKSEGVISVEIEERRGPGGPRGGGGFGAEEEELPTNYIIGPGEYKEIKMLCDERPNNMVINTNIAQNIPSEMMQNFQKIGEMTTDTTTGIFDVDESVFTLGTNEIIVDNEDKGFRTIEANQKNKLQNLFKKESEDKYKNLNFWTPPTRWTATVGISFYGDYINSCMYKKVGKGNNKAEWTAVLPESGYYEVYVYVPMAPGPRWMNREDNFQYYTVKHDDGEEEIQVKMTGPGSEGWFMLGTFHFSEGNATVTLSDKGSGTRQLIYADAVKWVYANNNK